MVMRYFILLVLTATVFADGDPVQSLTEEELQNYQFSHAPEISIATVKELNVGQQFTLDRKRRELKNLLYRHLGIRKLAGNRDDLKIIQQVIDKKILARDEVLEWQSLGVVFGDILVEEFGLSWVSYEDKLGVSKALRWRSTENYVFPVTMFSKRNRFKEQLDVNAIYDKLHGEINAFKLLPAPVAATRSTR
jgi:hypothetical protein|tara:strand:- start:863 stop:1438 length:576 start_codon:yes stop_codon:yes gene_type:complete